MYDEDKLTLFFSLEEKKIFLHKKGYTVIRVPVEKEMSVYQNVFRTVLSAHDVAIKDGERFEIHDAFNKEIKKQLLKI
ncbi:hypothetical protein KO02_17595 [Sphingobacterium sp. ML3W]|uniref:hypothetical protein n=1 Tax=Sphingobacterium sp. ML3W TaxID=1538644 RepID=UPI0004F80DD3|nr:hypothetical protein [Sphingobacterium sp. ML3W]AIM38297.1 hypothetical protein KO02_17595 [Sphingobacterium sp. ML3W]